MPVQTKSRFTSLCLVVGLIGIAAVSGCAKKTVVGKWTGTLPGPGGMTLPATVEYKADGTETMTTSAMGQSVVAQGTYKVQDDTLSETITSLTLAGRNMPVPGGKSQDATMKLDGDNLTLTPKNAKTPGSSYTFKRAAP